MTRPAEIKATNRNLQFRRAHSKQDNIWDQQYPAGERDIRSNLKEYPSREEAVSAWRRGAVRAQNMARRVGMHPFDEDVQIDDEHGGGGGGGGDGGGGVVVIVALVAMKVVMVVVVVVVAVVALVTLAVENLVMIKMVRKVVAKRLFLQTGFITHLKV